MKSFTDSSTFSDNATIDSTELHDSSDELVGYVCTVYPKTLAKNGVYVERIVVSNAQGRTVQLIAWANNTRILEKFETGEVLLVERVYSSPAKPNSLYNGGNVKFELIVNDKCNINILGTFNEQLIVPTSTTVDFDNIMNVQGPIKIGGYIKNSFRELKMKNRSIGIGSITNGVKKLEVHINKFFDQDDESKYQKGQYVEVTGSSQLRDNFAPPYIKAESVSDVRVDESKTRESLQFLLDGYHYVH
ncbi:hypothetical protein QAD02_013395 [Eretmocerus hayati]|uniref:Uncharacterized protein n=1 Tax=Eretmocerus hayati TaxID=131215 RepID=A0ACC2P3C0_9HYME|nr:hypothetical protein QAD02_013395 [Eretmocerus hayati]